MTIFPNPNNNHNAFNIYHCSGRHVIFALKMRQIKVLHFNKITEKLV